MRVISELVMQGRQALSLRQLWRVAMLQIQMLNNNPVALEDGQRRSIRQLNAEVSTPSPT